MNHSARATEPAIDVLIVEDSPTQALQLQFTLEQHGYRCAIAANGRLALAVMRQRKPMAVISDILMPEMDGYHLCRRIKADADLADIPVILLTSLADSADVIKGLECGADHFVVKPYDETLLLARLQYILANRQLRRVDRAQMGLEIFFAGQTHFITSDRVQILHLLLSTYEAAVQRNHQLLQTQETLQQLNTQLETIVAERTASLTQEIAERQRAEEALQRTAERLRILHSIDRAILGAQSPDAIAQAALGHVHRLIPSWRVGISLFDWAGSEGLVFASVGPDMPTFPVGTRISLEAYGTPDLETLRSGRLYRVADVLALAATPTTVQALQEEGLRSYVRVPMMTQGNLIGALNLWSNGLNTFTDEHLDIAREVADQLAIGIHQSRLYNQVQRHATDLEQRVAERTAELQEINAELESFSYTVSHDLRAPLRSIQGFAHILLEEYREQLNTTGGDYLQRIITAALRLDTLTDDLLTYSRMSHTSLDLHTVDLERIVEQALADLQAEITGRQAEITVDSPLPQVFGHSTILVQVVVNLLTNGLKFVAPGVQPHIRIWAEARQDGIRLSVRDNGIGIEPAYQERIFRIFERLHGTSAYPGTGIGLSIVRKGVERMGGRVGLQSAQGQGSTFWIELRPPMPPPNA